MLATTNDSAQPQRKIKLVVFDFDGTSIDGQSGALFSVYLWRHGLMSVPRALALAWWGLRYKLHLPQSQDEARELVFGALEDLSHRDIDKVMHEFYESTLKDRYRPEVAAEVAKRHGEGCVTLRVSATFAPIAADAAKALGVDDWSATPRATIRVASREPWCRDPRRSRRSRVGRTPTWARAHGRLHMPMATTIRMQRCSRRPLRVMQCARERRLGSWHGSTAGRSSSGETLLQR